MIGCVRWKVTCYTSNIFTIHFVILIVWFIFHSDECHMIDFCCFYCFSLNWKICVFRLIKSIAPVKRESHLSILFEIYNISEDQISIKSLVIPDRDTNLDTANWFSCVLPINFPFYSVIFSRMYSAVHFSTTLSLIPLRRLFTVFVSQLFS